MRTMLAGAIAAALVVALAGPALAKTETVRGKVIDQTCYMKDMASNAGKDHKMPKDVKDCAVMCAKKGMPMALLTSDGKVYTITGGLAADNNAKLIAHVGHTVAVTGDVTQKEGKTMIASAELKHIAAQ